MRIDIKTIARNLGSSFDVKLKFSPEDIDYTDDDCKIRGAISFDGKVTSSANRVIILEGRLYAGTEKSCDRCGIAFESDIDEYVEIVFRPVQDAKTPEALIDPEEIYTYDGFYLIPDKAFRDSIILSFPTKALCKIECKGLCSVCGCDLNEQDCGCADRAGI